MTVKVTRGHGLVDTAYTTMPMLFILAVGPNHVSVAVFEVLPLV